MKKILKNYRSLFIAWGFMLMFAFAFIAGNIWMQNQTENKVAASSARKLGCSDAGPTRAPASEISQEDSMRISLEMADHYLETMPDAPLLKENADPERSGYADSSLELSVDDVNACPGKAGKIIREFCKKNGVDASHAKIKDLTREQIAQIDMETFQRSEHGK